MGEEYPDIRSVPEREEALASRCIHEINEERERRVDFKRLEQYREKITARDEALRERLFPQSQEAKESPIQ